MDVLPPDLRHDDRPASLAEGLAREGLRPRSHQPGTYTLDCPRCARARRGKKSGSLHLKIDPDGMGAVWSCYNAGRVTCDWAAPQGFRVLGASPRGGARPQRVYRRPEDRSSPPPLGVVEWFAGRGISAATLEACGVRAARVWMPQTQREEDVVAFAFRRRGELVNWKYRGPNKAFRQEKDAEKIVFGLDDVRDQRTIAIVEGEIDKLALWEAGFRAACSVPDGAPARVKEGEPDPEDPKFVWLANCAEEFRPADQGGPSRIVLAVDADAPGRALEQELARRLGMDRCHRVRWPEGCKDANDVLLRDGPEALAALIERAEPYPIEGVMQPRDLLPEVLRLYDDGMPAGAPLGFDAVDFPDGEAESPLASLQPGQLVIVTGTPGSGKSEIVDQVMVNTAQCRNFDRRARERWPQGWKWAVLSMEVGPVRNIAGMAMKVTRRPFRAGMSERMSRDALVNAVDWLHEHFVWLSPPEGRATVGWIEETIRSLALRFGINGFVIDPYTEVDREVVAGQRETDVVGEFLTRVRRLCKVHDLTGVVVAHPAKPGAHTPKIPGLYDISGSAHWANKADLGFSVYRDRETPDMPTELHVKKVRFAENGRLGMARLQYVKVWHGFQDVPSRGYQE